MEVSVVVPTRGQSRWLREALASIEGAAEVILVADGAEVEGATLSLSKVGRSAARNAGVERARTPLVAFLDDDDRSLPGRLERQAAALAQDSGAVLAFGLVEKIDEEGHVDEGESETERERFRALVERGAGYESLLEDCPVYPSAVTVRRDAFLAAGGFRHELDAFEDLDLFLRLTRLGRLVPVEGGPVAQHRLHPANTPVERLFAGYARVAELHLADGVRGAARRRLLERQLEGLWGLGHFSEVRRKAYRALVAEPRLLARGGFRRRLAGSTLPAPVMAALRRRRHR